MVPQEVVIYLQARYDGLQRQLGLLIRVVVETICDHMEQDLPTDGIGDDRGTLLELLYDHFDTLTHYVASQIPQSLRGVIAAEDIVQQVFAEAIRDVGQFSATTDHSLGDWLAKIAKHRTLDAIRHFTAAKRGGRYQRIQQVTNPETGSLAELVDMLSAGSHTPSRSVARHELIAEVRQAIANLPNDYRTVAQLRFLEGRPLHEIAAVMNRSSGAVQGLVDRAKKKLRGSLGRLSLYE